MVIAAYAKRKEKTRARDEDADWEDDEPSSSIRGRPGGSGIAAKRPRRACAPTAPLSDAGGVGVGVGAGAFGGTGKRKGKQAKGKKGVEWEIGGEELVGRRVKVTTTPSLLLFYSQA